MKTFTPSGMTYIEAAKLLQEKYPQANIQKGDVSVDECYDGDGNKTEQITVYADPGCEFNTHAYCKDFFDLQGNHIGHKCC
jgi:hypothetical protein